MFVASHPPGLLHTVDALIYTASADIAQLGLALVRDGVVDPSSIGHVVLEINANLAKARELLAIASQQVPRV